MSKAAYKITTDVVIRGVTVFKAGDTVYPAAGPDNGAADKASAAIGVHHTSVSRNTDGKGLLVAVPTAALNSILVGF